MCRLCTRIGSDGIGVARACSRRIWRCYLGAAMPSFLGGRVEALDCFGGVPRVLAYDNFESAVLPEKPSSSK